MKTSLSESHDHRLPGKVSQKPTKTTVLAQRGARIKDITFKIARGATSTIGYGVAMLLVDTNNIENDTADEMITKYKELRSYRQKTQM